MNRSIRAVGTGLVVALACLGLFTAWHQAIAGPGYRDDIRNPRGFATLEERGSISVADGTVVARSVEGNRQYPAGSLFAHPVGYASRIFGAVGIEATRATELRPPSSSTIESLLTRLAGRDPRPSDVRLTIDPLLQEVTAHALGRQRGAAVALDVDSGAILAWVSSPSFDPNDLAGATALEAGEALSSSADGPLIDRVRSALYPPGSVFKVLVAAAALDAGMDPDSALDDLEEYLAPGTELPIRNYGGGSCASGSTITLADALTVSCNTAFAALGVELGAEAVTGAARAAGFGADLPLELASATSFVPPASELDADLPTLAQSAIGGRDVRVSPLHMALIAAAVAADGVAPRVRLVDAIVHEGTVETTEPAEWRRMFSEATASTLRSMMIDVVQEGTGTAARVPGVTVGGKTGTADVPGAPAHAWFIAFAHSGGRTIAVAVVVENGGDQAEAGTGGRVAAPIARAMIEAWVASAS